MLDDEDEEAIGADTLGATFATRWKIPGNRGLPFGMLSLPDLMRATVLFA